MVYISEDNDIMSGEVIKCNSSFISSIRKLKRTPMSKENKERRDFIKNHDFSIPINIETNEINIIAKDDKL